MKRSASLGIEPSIPGSCSQCPAIYWVMTTGQPCINPYNPYVLYMQIGLKCLSCTPAATQYVLSELCWGLTGKFSTSGCNPYWLVFWVYCACRTLASSWNNGTLDVWNWNLILNRALALQLNMESSGRHFPRWYHLLSFSLHDCNVSVSTKVMHNLN